MPNITGSPTQTAAEVPTLAHLPNLDTTPMTTGDMSCAKVGGVSAGGGPQLFVLDKTSTEPPDGDLFVAAQGGGTWIDLGVWTSKTATPTGAYAGTGPLALNDLVYVDADNHVARADASNILKLPAVGFVFSIDLAAAKPYGVRYLGEQEGFAGLVAGKTYYASDTTPGGITLVAPAAPGTFVQAVGVAKSAATFIVNPEVDIPGIVPVLGYPVSDAIFAVKSAGDPTKLFELLLAGQGVGTTTTIVTTAVVSRPFRLPNISGTGVVQQDVTGEVLLGSDVALHGSVANLQLSTAALDAAKVRTNQYGANTSAPAAVGFKSRGVVVGALAGLQAGDPLYEIVGSGVAPDGLSLPNAASETLQVPANFIPAAQAYLASEIVVRTTPLAGPVAQIAAKVTSEGETQTLRGVRAGGSATLPANLGTGTLWSSGAGSPEGVVVGSPGDVFSSTSGGVDATFWVKLSGVGTTTGWGPVSKASLQYVKLAVDYSNNGPVDTYTDIISGSIVTLQACNLLIRFDVTGQCADIGSGAVTRQASFRILVDGVDQLPHAGFTGGDVVITLGAEGYNSASGTVLVAVAASAVPHVIKLQGAHLADATPGAPVLNIDPVTNPNVAGASMTIQVA